MVARQREVEGRSLSLFAFHPDRAAMRLDDPFGDGKSQSSAHPLGTFCLPIGIEDVAEVFFGDAGSGIGDREENEIVLVRRGSAHDSARLRSELERVSDQIRENLNDAMAI